MLIEYYNRLSKSKAIISSNAMEQSTKLITISSLTPTSSNLKKFSKEWNNMINSMTKHSNVSTFSKENLLISKPISKALPKVKTKSSPKKVNSKLYPPTITKASKPINTNYFFPTKASKPNATHPTMFFALISYSGVTVCSSVME